MPNPIPTRFWLILVVVGVAIGFFLLPIFEENDIPSELFAIFITFIMLVIAEFRNKFAKIQNIIMGGLLLALGFIMALVLANLFGSV